MLRSKSATDCAFGPPPIIHLLLGEAASGLPSTQAAGSLFLRAAARHHTAGATLWVRRRERFSGCGGISSARAHTPTHYSSRWGDADGGGPGPRVRARGGGPARGADGPLEPTEGGEQREMLRQQ